MLRTLLSLFALFGVAFAATPFELRVQKALSEHPSVPLGAEIELRSLTAVRGAVETIEVIRFDARTGYFDAIIAHGSSEAAIRGRADVRVPAVVPVATLRRDHEITASDVEMRMVPMAQVSPTAHGALDDVIGGAVRRSLVAGRPIRQEDIGAPIVMRKNALVEILYETSGMSLAMKGRALDEGAVGEVIRVKSDGQDTIVHAEITGSGTVRIR